MARTMCIVIVFTILFVLVCGYPSKDEGNTDALQITCPVGQTLGDNGKCIETVPIVTPTVVQKATNGTKTPSRKQIKRRRKLKKRLNQEIKDMKKFILDGLGGEALNVSCPEGLVETEPGVCVEATNGTTTAPPKSKKALMLQKKVEKELERAFKKELQNEIRRRKRIDKNKEKKIKPDAAKPTTPVPVKQDGAQLQLPFCEDGKKDQTDCIPKS